MTRKQKRFTIIGVGMSFLLSAVLLVMFALSSEITYFHSPTDVIEKAVKPDTRIRLGGLVAALGVIVLNACGRGCIHTTHHCRMCC